MRKWFFLPLAFGLLGNGPAAEILPPGHRPVPPGVHAFTGARLVVKPGEIIEEGTLVIRDGFIAAAGKDVTPPADARVWNMKGLTIYAGLIDPFLTMAGSNPPVSTARSEPIDDRALTSGAGLNFFGVPGEEADPGGRGPGYQLPTITPERRIAESYTPNAKLLELMHELGFTAANIVPESGIIRGQSALVALSPMNPNEALLKADVFQHVAFSSDDSRESGYPRSLMGAIAAIRQVMFDADHYARDHEHYRKQPEGRKRPAFNPALEALAPAATKRMPVVIEGGSVLMSRRAVQMGAELGLNPIVLASGHEWRRPDLFQENRPAPAGFIVPINFPEIPKLPEEDDWEQVSLDQLRAWDWGPSNPSLLRKQGRDVALTTYGLGDKKQFRKKLRLVLDRGLSEQDALAALTTIPARLCGMERQLGTLEVGKIANLTVVEGTNYFQPDARVREVWVDGRMYPNKPVIEREKPDSAEKKSAATNRVDTLKTDPKSRLIRSERLARAPLEGRGPFATPAAVLVKGATVWTCGPQGILTNADVLISGGRIKAIGPALAGSGEGIVVDGSGKHVTPGLIDAHNHSMILGSVNEGTIPSSAMVRIADVVNSETAHIYRQLAGGLTIANLLHGSANPIGGQNCIIKLRDSASPDELKFAQAPPGIKFALGENVKQSSSDRSTRFPRSRMGVGTFIANRFAAAQQYLSEAENAKGRPIRRDLELETLGEILKGKCWIHCHSYRQDEILAFLRLMESLNVKVGTLQHVLEGYKVADEIAQHGAGASCFADWWAYKYEVIDAIPYAGSLMRERGVLVSFNSDSSDHARRMNFEAAKAVKYGSTTEEEALHFVTINPAKQLQIDRHVGSLEPGKDADFVVWSASPLDSKAVCLQTWIDGKKYFDREENGARVAALEKERDELIDKAKQILKVPGRSGASDEKAEATFFQVALEHQHDTHDRHCLDEER